MGAKQLEGLVRKGIGGFYTVETPEGLYTCTARGKFRKARISPYAGDRVRILAEEDGTGALEEILPRRNFLVRAPRPLKRCTIWPGSPAWKFPLSLARAWTRCASCWRGRSPPSPATPA